MLKRPKTLREWVVALFGGLGLALVPWTVWLSTQLPTVHTARSWDVAWTGFDIALVAAFLFTSAAAQRRSIWVGPFAAATATLLITDAWFDTILETGNARTGAIVLAFGAEMPMAAICVWVSLRTERMVASHLAAARQGAPERDLVGVLEIPADGQPAREPGHPHAAA